MLLKNFHFAFIALFMTCRAVALESDQQCPERPVDEAQAMELAGQLFTEAEKKYQDGMPIEALKGFLCSMRMMEHENTVFNISHIAEASTDKETVLALLKEYVSDAPQSAHVDSLKKIISDLEKRIEKESVMEPVDTQEQPQVDQPIIEPPHEEAPPPKKKRRKILTLISWIAMGTGTAGLVTGGILQGLAASAKADAEEATNYNQFLDEKDRMQSLQNGALAGFIAGGVIAGAGLVVYLLFAREDEKEKLELSFVPHSNGLILQGRF